MRQPSKDSLFLGHRIDTSSEPNPAGDLLRKGEEFYRVQSLNVDRPKAGKREVQVRCISCGEEVTLKVLSRPTQVTQAIFTRIIQVIIIVACLIVFSLLGVLFHLNFGPFFFFFGGGSLVIAGIVWLFSPFDATTPAITLATDHSKKHAILEGTIKTKEQWLEEGTAHYNARRYTEALAAYDQALGLAPNYADAYNDKGNALDSLGRGKEALAAYDQAISLTPNYANAYYGKGNILRKSKRYEEAITAYQQSLRLNPSFVSAYNNMSVALNNLNQYQEALAACDQAIHLNPNYAMAHYNAGKALQAMGRTDKAQQAFATARQLGYVSSEYNFSEHIGPSVTR
jgi:tetratricopeptide (TPR) repeat protein